MKLLNNYEYEQLLSYKAQYILMEERLALSNDERNEAQAECVEERHKHGVTKSGMRFLKEDLDKANSKITEIILEAAVNGLQIDLVPEVVVPAKVTPAKVTPAHIAVTRLGHFPKK